MKKENISDAMNMLSDDFIEETDRLRSGSVKAEARQRRVRRWGALAACVCLIAAGAFTWKFVANRHVGIPAVDTPEDSKLNSSFIAYESVDSNETLRLDDVGIAADLNPFFIYHGNTYSLYSFADNADIVGEKLGTATGGFNCCNSHEWVYAEFAGSVSGDFYEVKGYDPSFMLCMKDQWKENNSVQLYICGTGLTLKYGSELFENGLHISENYSALLYEEWDSWYYGKHNVFGLEGNNGLIEKFIADLDSAEFIPRESVPLEEKYESIFDTKLYHLYLEMKNGFSVNFHFLRGGYVIFEGMTDICVKISEETYNEMLEAFEKHD